jgi:hypothetical protein
MQQDGSEVFTPYLDMAKKQNVRVNLLRITDLGLMWPYCTCKVLEMCWRFNGMLHGTAACFNLLSMALLLLGALYRGPRCSSMLR